MSPGRLITALGLAAVVAPLGSTMMAVALDDLGRALGRDPADLTQWLVTSYLLVGIVGQSPGGRIGDLYGHGRALRLGQGLLAAGSLLGTAVASLPALIAARVLMAAGGALVVPCAFAVLRSEVPPALRGRAFGGFGAAMSAAAAVGPLLGGALVGVFGWRAVFLAALPLVAASAFLARFPARRAEAGPAPRFDWAGTLLLTAGLVALVVGLKAQAARWPLLAGGAALLLTFGMWERRAPAPVVDLRLFRQSAFSAGAAIVALQNLAMYALLFQLPLYFQRLHGATSAAMGRTLLVMMGAMVVLSALGGRLADRLGARVTTLAGTSLSLGGLAGLGVGLAAMRAPIEAAPWLVLLGAGFGLANAPSQAAAMGAVPRAQGGAAGGAISTLRYLGGVAGIAVLGRLDADAPAAAQTAAHVTSLWVFGGALVLAWGAALALPGRPAPAAAAAQGQPPG